MFIYSYIYIYIYIYIYPPSRLLLVPSRLLAVAAADAHGPHGAPGGEDVVPIRSISRYIPR